MKYLALILLIPILLVGCSVPTSEPGRTPSNSTIVPSAVPTATHFTATQTTTTDAVDEAEIRDLVENFGKKLQNVSLLAPDAGQEIEMQYSEFVSRALLEMWMGNVSKAPGRVVSSPWPDRIEISSLTREDPGEYVITGYVVEVTSVEVVNGGAAAKIPVRMVVQEEQGGWVIAEYAENQ